MTTVLRLGTVYRSVVRFHEKKDSYLPYFEKPGEVIYVPAYTEVWLEKISVLERKFQLANSDAELNLKGYLPEPIAHMEERLAKQQAKAEEDKRVREEHEAEVARAAAEKLEELETRKRNRWWRRLWRFVRGSNLPRARLLTNKS